MPIRKNPTRAAAAEPVKAVKTTKAAAPAKTPKTAVQPSMKPSMKLAAKAPLKRAPKAPAKLAEPAPKAAKPRDKLVRDSFTMPQADFVLIDLLKQRALGFKRPTKKSELLRAGLQALAAMPQEALKAALGQLVALKTGRPKKGG